MPVTSVTRLSNLPAMYKKLAQRMGFLFAAGWLGWLVGLVAVRGI